MKKRLFALLSCAALAAASITGCSSQKPAESAAASAEAESTTGAPSKEVGDYKIALITMDSIDQHWVTLNEGAQEEAKELGVTVSFMSPNTKDDAQQIECVNNAVAGGYQAIIVAANGPDAISSARKQRTRALRSYTLIPRQMWRQRQPSLQTTRLPVQQQEMRC